MRWIATAAFALEGVVARQLRQMGAQQVEAQSGAVRFEGGMEQGFAANLWLRASDRVLLEMASFEARSFEELFEEDAPKMEMIVTFMALLDMLMRGEISIKQPRPYEKITITAKELREDDEDAEYMDEQ